MLFSLYHLDTCISPVSPDTLSAMHAAGTCFTSRKLLIEFFFSKLDDILIFSSQI